MAIFFITPYGVKTFTARARRMSFSNARKHILFLTFGVSGMTKKKNIVRHKVNTLDGKIIDFHSFDVGGAHLTRRERAFVFWYTYPGSEAFMNAGRAAVRAGYKKSSAVMLGCRVRHKPEIATAITKILDERVRPGLEEALWRITWLCSIRMFFDVSDFYRSGKRVIKIRGRETEIEILEIVPLNELTYQQRMCIDGIDYRGPHGIPVYILPDRGKAYKLFMKCYEILKPEQNDEKQDYKETAEIIRGIA
jgi:hypothetical protein